MWRQVALFVLIGLGSSAIAIFATILLALGFSILLMVAVVMVMAGTNTEVTSSVAEGILLPMAGALAGLSGGLPSGTLIRRIWPISHRWLVGWTIVWLLGGVGIWSSIWAWREIMTTTEMFFYGSGMWMLLGIVCTFVFSVILAPWRYQKIGRR